MNKIERIELHEHDKYVDLSSIGWLEKGPFSKSAYLNPSKTFEHNFFFLDCGKISNIELENFMFCPKNTHFRKKMGAHLFSKKLKVYVTYRRGSTSKCITVI
jgi:hypothetical protein